MTEQEYNEYPAIRRSSLWKVLESPEKYKYSIDHPEEPTPALIFGQAFHTMALQPDEFDKQFAVLPNVDRRTKQGKAEYADFIEQNEGKTIITQDIFQQITEMCEKLNQNAFFNSLMLNAEVEKPIFWVDEFTGEFCKVRLDILNTNGSIPIIVDLKTTENANNKEFAMSAFKYGYHLQVGMYGKGAMNYTKSPEYRFIFIAIEKKPPYAINIIEVDKEFKEYGEITFDEALAVYQSCKETDNWYGYLGLSNEMNVLSLPSWISNKQNKEEE